MSAGEISARARQRWAELQTQPWWPRVAPLLIAAALILVGAVGAAALLDSVREQDGVERLDRPVWSWLVNHRGATRTRVFEAISATFTLPILPVIVVVVAAFLIWRARSRWPGGLLITAMIAATLLSTIGKVLVGRARPPRSGVVDQPLDSYAFPSGHTLAAAAFMLVLGYLLWTSRRTLHFLVAWGAVSVLVVGAVALSRMYLGYHWTTDVGASAFLSLVVLGCVVAVDAEHTSRSATRVTRQRE